MVTAGVLYSIGDGCFTFSVCRSFLVCFTILHTCTAHRENVVKLTVLMWFSHFIHINLSSIDVHYHETRNDQLKNMGTQNAIYILLYSYWTFMKIICYTDNADPTLANIQAQSQLVHQH